MKQKLVDQTQQRSKLLGRKDLLLESLLELGFKTPVLAHKKLKELKSKKEKFKKQYDSKFFKFMENYEHLL